MIDEMGPELDRRLDQIEKRLVERLDRLTGTRRTDRAANLAATVVGGLMVIAIAWGGSEIVALKTIGATLVERLESVDRLSSTHVLGIQQNMDRIERESGEADERLSRHINSVDQRVRRIETRQRQEDR